MLGTGGVLEQYLLGFEKESKTQDLEDYYLWPRTPIDSDHQSIIKIRVGASDQDVTSRISRPALIINHLHKLVKSGQLDGGFSVLDVACGDAIVLAQIKKAFPESCCFGLDCYKGAFRTHQQVEREGVLLFRGFLQQLFAEAPPARFDVVLMLNTYRGWESANLREKDKGLPALADQWLRENGRFIFLTATQQQILRWRSTSQLQRLGVGEEDSELISISRESQPSSWFDNHRARWVTRITRGKMRHRRKRSKRWPHRLLRLPLRAVYKITSHRWMRHCVWFLIELPIAFVVGRVTHSVFAGYMNQLTPKWLRSRRERPATTYVFTFLGEFGYELLNWQGVVRRFARHLPDSSEIVIAGRQGLEPFYEDASTFIDISDLPVFKNSVAITYFALPSYQLRRYNPPSFHELNFDESVRREIRDFVAPQIARRDRKLEFVWSSERKIVRGLEIGVDRHFHWGIPDPGSIYEGNFVANNTFSRIDPDLSCRTQIEKELGMSLEEPFVLVQERQRKIGPQHGLGLSIDPLITVLAKRVRVVQLSFSTGRALDSGSFPVENHDAMVFRATSFLEQGCLIHFAQCCIFASEGDLGSHTYLPPLMGRDVVVVASGEVFGMHSAPVEFWNERVFRFGGSMISWPSEEVLASRETLEKAVDTLKLV